MKKLTCVFMNTLFFCACVLKAAETSLGLPLITNYLPEEYNADTQNWAAATDQRGLLYVANNSGVLECDGHEWKLLIVGDNLAARSLAIGHQNRIYVGAFGDFGYLAANERGNLEYISLGISSGLKAQEIGDVVTTALWGDKVVFLSSDGLFLVDGTAITTIRPRTRFHLGYSAGGTFFVRQKDLGLFWIDHQQLRFIEGSQLFKDDRIYAMFPTGQEGEILLASRDNGFFLFYPEYDSSRRFKSYQPLNKWKDLFQRTKVSVCDRMSDGSIVFATTQDGVYIITNDGLQRLHLNRSSGLLDDVVYYVFCDRSDNLVLCHSVGISYIETGSPFRFIHEKLGVKGTGNAAFIPVENPGVYTEQKPILLGTYQGLFSAVNDISGETKFKMVPETTETWEIAKFRDQILVASSSGVFSWDKNRLQPILKKRLALSFLKTPGDDDSLLVGAFDGLARLVNQNDQWSDAPPIDGFSQAAFDLCAHPDGSVWLHSYSGDGLYRVFFEKGWGRVSQIRKYGIENGLPSNGGNIPYQTVNGVLVATRKGIYRYKTDADRFEISADFSEHNSSGVAVDMIHQDDHGDIWIFGKTVSGVYRLLSENRYHFQSYPYSRLSHFHLGQYFNVFQNGQALLAYKDGFISFVNEGDTPKEMDEGFLCLIRKIEYPGGILFGGTSNNEINPGAKSVQGAPIPVLPFKMNKLRFNFATSFMEGTKYIEFSYWLRGFDKDWSSWSKQTISSYTNLEEGQYEFWVKARDCYGQISPADVYKLLILPPWYRTIWAYVSFFILGLALLTFIVKFYNRQLLKDKMRLEQLVAEKTHELKEISLSDPLTGLRNRRFIKEIVQPEVHSFVEFKKYLLLSEDSRFSDVRQTVFGIFLFDIDHFKQVNDEYGHDAGDRVLKQFSDMLRGCIRADDFIIRWGGEEFLVVLKKTLPEYVTQFAEKRRDSMSRQPFILDDKADQILHKTVSIGVVSFPVYPGAPDLVSFEQAVMIADLGLYYAKTHGRNRSVLIKPGAQVPTAEELEKCLHSLDYAVENGFLKLE